MSKVKLYNSARYPTSLLVRGADELGIEIAKSLLDQGGYVIIIDDDSDRTNQLLASLSEYKLLTVLDYSSIDILETELRRLDYVFYFQHKSSNLTEKISSQEFLQFSNYLDTILDITTKFEAKFLLTSSIKAHQMIIANKQMDIDFSPGNDDRHSRYTELEIQRYAESLVKEYQEKVGLDARIIRLGILLGKPFDPQDKSALYDLIIQGLAAQNLVIPGDGLDSDYYIHYLDAAYGIIKAQFSLNTSGSTFSLCNEEQISMLSIAYKLIEILPNASEIKFDSNNNDLPPLRLYKPATNLAEIGWKPRVSFERALAQTIDVIKNYAESDDVKNYVEKENTKLGYKKSNSSLMDKITGVFFIKNPVNRADDVSPEPADALAKLISERKTQDKARLGSIIMANKVHKDREFADRNKGMFKQIDNGFNNLLFALKRRFGFLKSLTLFDFFAWTFVLAALTIVYFIVVSPSVALIRDAYQLKKSQEKVITSINNSDYQAAYNDVVANKTVIKDAQERLSDVHFLFSITQNAEAYTTSQKMLDGYQQLYEGLADSLNALIPMQQYMKAFNPRVTYRYSDSALLSVDSSVEYDELLAKIKGNYSSYKFGSDKVVKSVEDIVDLYGSLPEQAKNLLGFQIEDLKSQTGFVSQLAGFYNYLPAATGYQQTRNYLFVIQDNSRYTAAGGEIAGYIIVQYRNGAIKEITIKNAKDFNSKALSISKEAFDEIKLMSNTVNDANNIKFSDLSLISNQKLFFKEVANQISREENIKIDASVSINIKLIEELMTMSGPIQFQDNVYNKENLLSKIDSTTDKTDTYNSRNTIILNLYATILQNSFNTLNQNFVYIYKTLQTGLDEQNVRFYSEDPVFSVMLGVNTSQIDLGFNDYINYGVNYQQSSSALDKYPVVTLTGGVKLKADYTTDKRIEMSVLGGQSLQNAYTCIPSGAKDFDLTQIDKDLVSRSFTNDKICYTFLKSKDLKYKFTYGTLPFTVSKTDKIYRFVIVSNPGLSANYDFEFEFASELGQIEPVDTNFIKQGSKYIYSGRVSGSKTFTFKILK
jgi:nucleoside-diphosphate-sugar epimerase